MRRSNSGSLKAKAYNQIKNMILLRELRQGEKIFEKDLAEKMQMSRTPVREALLILEQEKLVENQDRLGFIVRRLKSNEIEDYYNIREVMESYAAPFIVDNITELEIETLKENVAKAEAFLITGDIHNFVLCNSQFHDLLSKTTHSDIFCRVISSLSDIAILLLTIALTTPTAMKESISGHKKIIKALEIRDIDVLKKILTKHIQGSKKRNQGIYDLII